MYLFGIYVLSEDPPVFAMSDAFAPRFLSRVSPQIQPELLVFPQWTKESYLEALKTKWFLRRLPKRRATWMCATPREVYRLCRFGYQALWCHHNLFCDESVFRISDAEKMYDAAYTAVIQSYKRLSLAQRIPSIRIFTRSIDRIDELKQLGLGHAVVNRAILNREGVAQGLGTCRVGLALSEVEGGMFACTEYLLCGLPVVSTPSLGGRDVWLDAANSQIVPATADEVAAAVRHFVEQPPDPEKIRNEAVRRVKFFRTALAEIVRRKTGRLPFDAELIDGSWFTTRFVAIQFLDEYLASYANGRFARADLLGKFA